MRRSGGGGGGGEPGNRGGEGGVRSLLLCCPCGWHRRRDTSDEKIIPHGFFIRLFPFYFIFWVAGGDFSSSSSPVRSYTDARRL